MAVTALVLTAIGHAMIACAVLVRPAWRLTYNPSPSAARGFYGLTPLVRFGRADAVEAEVRIGDQLLLWPPIAAAQLADRRGYVPSSVPLLKSVSALFRARVCRFGAAVTIDGRLAALARARDHAGRPMPVWQGCRRLERDEVFALGHSPDSFDGRYFGPVARSALIARATPLWTW